MTLIYDVKFNLYVKIYPILSLFVQYLITYWS